MAAPVTIVWFRDDLRLSDHPALSAAVAQGGPVVPVFILDDRADRAWARGGASRWWLHHSLTSLANRLAEKGARLILRRGDPSAVMPALVAETGAERIHWTRGYSAAARALDEAVRDAVTGLGEGGGDNAGGVTCKRYAGRLIFEPEEITTGSGTPYKVFTPFWRACTAKLGGVSTVEAPASILAPTSWPESEALDDWALLPRNLDWSDGFTPLWSPGEDGAQSRLQSFLDGPVKNYGTARDKPAIDGTSRLSPHLHFGEISPRQVLLATRHADAASGGDGEKFLAEIGWREFSHHLLFHWPKIPDAPFRPEYAAFPWQDDAEALRRWQHGQTGYPIVDAGMRQLYQTGWMHNRVRMIVASFLIKHLRIDWVEGEKWFWDCLVDADLASNSAGWQWVAGSGTDASPYFRIFNPMSQGEKFDPEGAYVRRFVPELAKLPKSAIHAPWTADSRVLKDAGVTLGETYPKPMVDHAEARKKALEGYEVVKAANG
ncbi:MAG: deoxyribodipyrimidine photo-lyase [Pseudomonadota bacterium]